MKTGSAVIFFGICLLIGLFAGFYGKGVISPCPTIQVDSTTYTDTVYFFESINYDSLEAEIETRIRKTIKPIKIPIPGKTTHDTVFIEKNIEVDDTSYVAKTTVKDSLVEARIEYVSPIKLQDGFFNVDFSYYYQKIKERFTKYIIKEKEVDKPFYLQISFYAALLGWTVAILALLGNL